VCVCVRVCVYMFIPPAVYPILQEAVGVGVLFPLSDLQTPADAQGTAALRPCTDPDHTHTPNTHICINANLHTHTHTQRERENRFHISTIKESSGLRSAAVMKHHVYV